MANDIIDITVGTTTDNIEITINPNLTTVNINEVTGVVSQVNSVNGRSGDVTGLAEQSYVIAQDLLKVDKEIGKGLSTNDYTTTEKNKLAGISEGAEVNVNADWNATSGDALILNKPVIPITTNFVPYTGAISDVNLGEFGVQLGNLEFDLTPTNTPTTVGSLSWNDTDGTLDLKLKGGNTILQIGQETVARIVNKTTTNITLLEANYQAVRVTGAQGQRPKVDLALANNDANSASTLGLVTETILNNQEGFITTSGQVKQINTTGSLQGETWLDGDILYLSGTIAGQITNIKPIAPIHTVIIGFVEYAHAINGKIFVKVDNGYELNELHNVSAIAPNNNEVLTYDLATTLWKPKTVTSALGYTPYNATNPNNYISTISEINAGGELSGSYPNPSVLNSAVTNKILTGVNITGGTILSTDSILTALGKVQNQINGLIGGSIYQSVWNASTNTPTLISSVGTKGYYYIVSVDGSTNLNGITDWKVGDWAIYNGTTWNKVDNSDSVSSVNGFTGAVSLTTANISEVTNLYYTEARVNANTNVSANTDSRHNALTLGVNQNGLSLSTQVLSLELATTSLNGALSSTDWNTFNNKFTLPTLINGSVLFSNGTTIAQNNANFFWDNTNNRLGIGNNTPTSNLSIGNGNSNFRIDFSNERGYVGYNSTYNTTGAIYIDGGGTANKAIILNPVSTANVGIGTITPTQKLHVIGNGLFTGSVTATQFRISALNTTPASATATGILGEIRYDANYMYVCVATNTWKRSAITTW